MSFGTFLATLIIRPGDLVPSDEQTKLFFLKIILKLGPPLTLSVLAIEQIQLFLQQYPSLLAMVTEQFGPSGVESLYLTGGAITFILSAYLYRKIYRKIFGRVDLPSRDSETSIKKDESRAPSGDSERLEIQSLNHGSWFPEGGIERRYVGTTSYQKLLELALDHSRQLLASTDLTPKARVVDSRGSVVDILM